MKGGVEMLSKLYSRATKGLKDFFKSTSQNERIRYDYVLKPQTKEWYDSATSNEVYPGPLTQRDVSYPPKSGTNPFDPYFSK